MFWVISVYFNLRNILRKSGTFLLGHPVYVCTYIYIYVCVCVCIYIYAYVCMSVYVCIYIYIYVIMRFSTYGDLTLCVCFPNKFNDNFPGQWTGHPRISDAARLVLFLFCSTEQKFWPSKQRTRNEVERQIRDIFCNSS